MFFFIDGVLLFVLFYNIYIGIHLFSKVESGFEKQIQELFQFT